MKTCKRVIMLALMVTVLVSFCACSKKDYDIKDACDLIESVLDKDRLKRNRCCIFDDGIPD